MYDYTEIIKSLRNELVLQKRHIKLLQAQNMALIACDRPRFFQLFEGYSAFLQEMKQHASQRDSCLRGASVATAVEDWPEAQAEIAKKLSNQIKQALERARAISAQNQKLIARELTYIDFLLNLYVEAGRRSASYAHSGSFAPSIGNRLINQVA